MTNALDLSPSLEKVRRAERKLENVETILNGWIAGGIRYTIRREIHDQRVHVIARIEDLLPEDVAWEIVEGIGHIRAALDKMLVALVESNGRGVSGVSFPFGGVGADGTPEPFPTGRHIWLEKKLTPEQWALVLAQRPYSGGNDLLWAVNELANQDKHRKDLVKVTAQLRAQSITISQGVFIGTGTGAGIALGGDANFACADQERESLLMSYAFGPGSFHPNIDQTMGIGVNFGPIRPVEGMEVLGVFSQQIGLVKAIIELFESTFG